MAEESRSYSELVGIGGKALSRQTGTPVSTYVLTLGAASAVLTYVLNIDSHYRVVSDVDCWIRLGADATVVATNTDMYLPAKQPMVIRAKDLYIRLAGIAGGAGKLYVTLMEGT